MLFDLLTEQEKEMINTYRDWCAYSSNTDFCPIETLLSPWVEAKSQYLEKLFKDTLIVEFPIRYKQDFEELSMEIDKLRFEDDRSANFLIKLYGALYDNSLSPGFVSPFCGEYLASNKIGENISISLKDGSVLKFQKGSKTIKAVIKIAEKFRIGLKPTGEKINGKIVSDLEYFRLKHSVVLNQKTLKGELCLSIHPLDYITMSDNCERWSSCMSWNRGGDYRQGTVEMMNSPCVVVGYLKSNNNKLPIKDKYWNSKKWRSLFIVDPEFIISIKGYPYQNEYLAKACIDKLAKMAGWDNYKITTQNECQEVVIDFYTSEHSMYNDFGTVTHYVCPNPEIDGVLIDGGYNYCGDSECMCCGRPIEYYNGDESELCCEQCNPQCYCDCCGCHICDGEESITTDDYTLCPECWDANVMDDDITGDPYYHLNTIRVKIKNNNDKYWFFPCYISDDTLYDDCLLKKLFVNGKTDLKDKRPMLGDYEVELASLTFEGIKAFKVSLSDLSEGEWPGYSSLTPEQLEELKESLENY